MKTEPTISIQDEVAKIHAQYGTTEMANYRIEKLLEKYIEQSNPKIKQLEWLDDNFPYRGCSVFVDYIISNKIGSRYTVILDIGTGIYINSFKTIDEAKAAAQRDFEKRIKECLA